MRATTVLLALACAAPLAGCEKLPTEPFRNELVFERADGSRIQFAGRPQVWCGAWEEGTVGTQTLHIRLGSSPSGPGWQLRAVIPEVQTGRPLTFPNEFIWNDPRGVDLFVLDEPNELSTQATDSSGSITFERLDCSSSTGGVAFEIDAVVGSELGGGPPVSVRGSFRSPITGRP